MMHASVTPTFECFLCGSQLPPSPPPLGGPRAIRNNEWDFLCRHLVVGPAFQPIGRFPTWLACVDCLALVCACENLEQTLFANVRALRTRREMVEFKLSLEHPGFGVSVPNLQTAIHLKMSNDGGRIPEAFTMKLEHSEGEINSCNFPISSEIQGGDTGETTAPMDPLGMIDGADDLHMSTRDENSVLEETSNSENPPCSPLSSLMSAEEPQAFSSINGPRDSSNSEPPAKKSRSVPKQAPDTNAILGCSVKDCTFKGTVNEKKQHLKTVHDWKRLAKCGFCDEFFKERGTRYVHEVKKHGREHRYGCEDCGEKFYMQVTLRRHQEDCSAWRDRMVQQGAANVKCKFQNCGFESHEVDMLRHVRRMHRHKRKRQRKSEFPCEICGKIFTRGKERSAHMAKDHEIEPMFSCEKCGKKFWKRQSLKRHSMVINCLEAKLKPHQYVHDLDELLEVMESEVNNQAIPDPQDSSEDPQGPSQDPQAVEARSIKKRKPWNFIRKHTGPKQCSRCLKLFTKEEVERGEFTQHWTNVHNPLTKCPFEGCDFVGGRKLVLYKHRISVHEKGYIYACNFCNEKFMEKETFLSHKNRVHLKKACFVCPDCGKAMWTENTLRAHMKNTHREGQPAKSEKVVCDLCGEERSLLRMEKHRLICGKGPAKNYPCDMCDTVLSDAGTLSRHKATKHGVGQLRPGDVRKTNTCEECGKQIKSKQYFAAHMLTQHNVKLPYLKEFKCNTCGKTLFNKKVYQEHLHGHMGKREHSCDICGYTSNISSNINLHKRRVHAKGKGKGGKAEQSTN